jgi:hypothetical protein
MCHNMSILKMEVFDEVHRQGSCKVFPRVLRIVSVM